MRILCFITLMIFSNALFSQLPYSPLPYGSKDFALINKSGITRVFKYVVNADKEKALTTITDFANKLMVSEQFVEVDALSDTAVGMEINYKYSGPKQSISDETQYDETGSPFYSIHYTYNAKAQLIKSVTDEVDPFITTYKYDTKGRLTEKYTVNNRPVYSEETEKATVKVIPFERVKFVYDTKGRLTEELSYNLMEDAKTPSKTKFSYNAKGQLIKKIVYDISNAPNAEINYTYNKEGLVSKTWEKDYVTDEVTHSQYEYCKGCELEWMKN